MRTCGPWGFGPFGTKRRPAHTGRNPHSGESVEFAAATAPRFGAGKPLRDAVKAGGGRGTSQAKCSGRSTVAEDMNVPILHPTGYEMTEALQVVEVVVGALVSGLPVPAAWLPGSGPAGMFPADARAEWALHPDSIREPGQAPGKVPVRTRTVRPAGACGGRRSAH